MILKTTMILIILLLIASYSGSTRPGSTMPSPPPLDQHSNSKGNDKSKGDIIGGWNHHFGGGAGDYDDFFGPRGRFTIPRFRNGFGGGYGAGFGGPDGGYSKNGEIRQSLVCKEKGPCYGKNVTCPARCFTSFSRSGQNFGAGGGGGGCTVDCKKKCIASC